MTSFWAPFSLRLECHLYLCPAPSYPTPFRVTPVSYLLYSPVLLIHLVLFFSFAILYIRLQRTRSTWIKVFLLYLTVPMFVVVSQLLLMPKNSNQIIDGLGADGEASTQHEESSEWHSSEESRIDALREGRSNQTGRLYQRPPRSPSTKVITSNQNGRKEKRLGGVWGILHALFASQQIKTLWFILVTFFTVLRTMRVNYFVATIRAQYGYLVDNYTLARRINHVFDIVLPFGVVISAPLAGLVLDNVSTPAVLGLLVVLQKLLGFLVYRSQG